MQSAYVPLRKYGRFVGVLNFNYLVTYLSTVINKNISDSNRYCYLIDTNSSALISHPKLNSSCKDILCAEGFSKSEYAAFLSMILLPVRNGSLASHMYYMKQGKSWLITGTKMEYGDIQYTVLATVPRSEVEKTSADIKHSIDKYLRFIVIVFVVCVVVLVVILLCHSRAMVASIVNPVNDLRRAFSLIQNDDLSGPVPTEASSRDLKVLLHAFSNVYTNIHTLTCIFKHTYIHTISQFFFKSNRTCI